MKLFKLEYEQLLPFPVEHVFSFFLNPTNLEKLTPNDLRFQMITPSPIQMQVGTVIDYTIQVWSLPLRWTTIITEYEPPYKFVDLQLKGPYAYWHHLHHFCEKEGQTMMKDTVHYALPLGVFGRILHKIKVKNDLRKIFEYRRDKIVDYLR